MRAWHIEELDTKIGSTRERERERNSTILCTHCVRVCVDATCVTAQEAEPNELFCDPLPMHTTSNYHNYATRQASDIKAKLHTSSCSWWHCLIQGQKAVCCSAWGQTKYLGVFFKPYTSTWQTNHCLCAGVKVDPMSLHVWR